MKQIKVSTVKQLAEVQVIYLDSAFVINAFRALHVLNSFIVDAKESTDGNLTYLAEDVELYTQTFLANLVNAFDPEEKQEPEKSAV